MIYTQTSTVKGDTNNRESNGDPNNAKNDRKDRKEKSQNAGSKSSKKTTTSGSKSTLLNSEPSSANLELCLETRQ